MYGSAHYSSLRGLEHRPHIGGAAFNTMEDHPRQAGRSPRRRCDAQQESSPAAVHSATPPSVIAQFSSFTPHRLSREARCHAGLAENDHEKAENRIDARGLRERQHGTGQQNGTTYFLRTANRRAARGGFAARARQSSISCQAIAVSCSDNPRRRAARASVIRPRRNSHWAFRSKKGTTEKKDTRVDHRQEHATPRMTSAARISAALPPPAQSLFRAARVVHPMNAAMRMPRVSMNWKSAVRGRAHWHSGIPQVERHHHSNHAALMPCSTSQKDP